MNRIILALDTTNLEEAISITKKVKNKIFTVKLGLEFFNAHDIPETVYKATKALNDIKFGFLTIHGQGGKSMISRAKKASEEIESKPNIMMVTILTALSDSDLKDMGNNNSVTEQVEKLAKVAKEMEVGVVCSGHEAKIVRKIIGPDLFIFTPGIRMNEDQKDDQRRICTPIESIKNGANKIIMGRSLMAGNIEENLNKVSNSLKI